MKLSIGNIGVIVAVLWTLGGAAFASPGERVEQADPSPLGPPPPLPSFPTELKWPEPMKKQINETIENYAGNQVSAHLKFHKLLANKTTPDQKKWLQSVNDATKGRALEVLERDLKQAVATADVRATMIIAVVAGKVSKDGLPESAAVIAKTKDDISAGKVNAAPVWKIQEPKGRWLSGDYSEAVPDKLTFKAGPGCRLLRVTARVENISANSDVTYCHDSLFFGFPQKHVKPARLADQQFLYLLAPGGDWIQCGIVCDTSNALRTATLTIPEAGKSGRRIAIGCEIEQGDSFLADIIFVVPQGIEDLRLLVLGSPPLAVKIDK